MATTEKTDWNALRDRAYECAKAHGWHEQEHNARHYLMLVVTELAEAVQADRKGRRADRRMFEEFMEAHDETALKYAYPDYIAGTVEDEFADVVIRLLDFAGIIGLDLSGLQDMLDFIENDKKNAYKLFNREFIEIAYEFTDILTFDNYRRTVFEIIAAILTWGRLSRHRPHVACRTENEVQRDKAVQARQKVLNLILTNEDMEEVKKLTIPEDYEFDRVEDGKVILKKKEAELPKTWDECTKGLGMSYYPAINWHVPNENENALRALCNLLICRNAWWKRLGWKPDWSNNDKKKYCIYTSGGVTGTDFFYDMNKILAFPTKDICDQFYEAFCGLIKEAKELL